MTAFDADRIRALLQAELSAVTGEPIQVRWTVQNLSDQPATGKGVGCAWG